MGGSNYTGSYTTTSSLTPEVPVVQGAATISGYIHIKEDGYSAPQANVHIVLTGTNDLGQSISEDLWTDSSGMYSFVGLRAGTYSLTEYAPDAPYGYDYDSSYSSPGTINGLGSSGTAQGTTISGITLQGNDAATDYDFTNRYISLG
jgi:uncharacterized surface anchored protein